MSNKKKTYEDLLHEEQRLLSQLKASEVLIRNDIAGVREGLKPLRNTINTIGKFTTRDKTGPLANFGIDFGIDLVVRKLLLAKAGWLTKIVVPFVVKNYSSHFITDQQKAKLMEKINGIFSKLRPKAEQNPGAAQTA